MSDVSKQFIEAGKIIAGVLSSGGKTVSPEDVAFTRMDTTRLLISIEKPAGDGLVESVGAAILATYPRLAIHCNHSPAGHGIEVKGNLAEFEKTFNQRAGGLQLQAKQTASSSRAVEGGASAHTDRVSKTHVANKVLPGGIRFHKKNSKNEPPQL